jgi:hypothetical protein
MAELTRSQVEALAASIGLPLAGDDLAEVTHRLNAFVEALAPLGELPIDGIQPVPFLLELLASESGGAARSEP